jgi:hypothetical protein
MSRSTKRPHLPIDTILAEGVADITLFGVERVVVPMPSDVTHMMANIDAGTDGKAVSADEKLDRYTTIVAACIKPSVEPKQLRILSAEMLTAIIELANGPSKRLEEALASGAPEGNGQGPATTPSPS